VLLHSPSSRLSLFSQVSGKENEVVVLGVLCFVALLVLFFFTSLEYVWIAMLKQFRLCMFSVPAFPLFHVVPESSSISLSVQPLVGLMKFHLLIREVFARIFCILSRSNGDFDFY
jgi:hypothetical protein